MAIEPGSQLGAYTVLARIGCGGMGDVFKARDPRLGRLVAIKTLAPSRLGDSEAQTRFEREARILAELSHPNILVIHDVGHADGNLFLVTEFLEGESLSALLARGGIPLERAVAIAKGIAQGLAAAHARGIVHRDLKPANVFLLRTGQVKLLDFGLAKDLALDAFPDGHSVAGSILGTIGYLSPEQACGEPVDARADLFNLGILLLEMVTGKSAFRRETAMASVHATLQEKPAGLLDEVPPPLRPILDRCLEKDPDLRFQSASDLAFALEMIGPVSSVPSAHAVHVRPRRWVKSGLLVAAGLMAVAGLIALVAGGLPRRDTREPSFRPITPGPAWVTAARFSKDGRTIAYSMQGADWVQRICTFSEGDPMPQELPLVGKVVAIGNGGELYFTDEERSFYPGAGSIGTLFRRKGRSEAPRPWQEEVQEVDLDSTGQHVALIRQEPHQKDSPTTSVLECPPGRTLARVAAWISSPRISPDGKRIAFIRRSQFVDLPGEIVVVDLEGREHFVSRHLDSILTLAWAPDGRGVLYSWNPAPGTPFRISRMNLDGRETHLLSGPQSLVLMDVAPDGRLLVFGTDWDTGTRRAFLERSGHLEEMDLGARIVDDCGSMSPDGTRIAYAIREADGRDAIHLRMTDGSAPVRLGVGSFALAISPDNAWVLVQRRHMRMERGHPVQLVLVPTGPGHEIPLRTEGILEVHHACFLPGQARVLVGAGADHGNQPMVVSQDSPPAPLPGALPNEKLFKVLGEKGVVVQAYGKPAVLLSPSGRRHPLPWRSPSHIPVGWDSRRQELILLEGPRNDSDLQAWLRRREVHLNRGTLDGSRLRPERSLTGDTPFFASKLPYLDLSRRAFMVDTAFRGTLFVVEGVPSSRD